MIAEYSRARPTPYNLRPRLIRYVATTTFLSVEVGKSSRTVRHRS